MARVVCVAAPPGGPAGTARFSLQSRRRHRRRQLRSQPATSASEKTRNLNLSAARIAIDLQLVSVKSIPIDKFKHDSGLFFFDHL